MTHAGGGYVDAKGEGHPGNPAEDGKLLVVLKRQPDGTWKYQADMFGSNAK